MPRKNKTPKSTANINTAKSRTRYDLLKIVSEVMFPEEQNKHGGSKILTAFSQALYQESPTPERLSKSQVAQIVKQVLADRLRAMEE